MTSIDEIIVREIYDKLLYIVQNAICECGVQDGFWRAVFEDEPLRPEIDGNGN